MQHGRAASGPAARLASIERAFAHYGSSQVLRPLLDEWTTSAYGSLTATA